MIYKAVNRILLFLDSVNGVLCWHLCDFSVITSRWRRTYPSFMILRIRWKFLTLLVLFVLVVKPDVIYWHDCVWRRRSLWRVDGRWRHRDYVIGDWRDHVAILGVFCQVFLPAVLFAAITAGVAFRSVLRTLVTWQTRPVTQRFSAYVANVHGCDWRWFEVYVVATPWRPVCVSYYDVIGGSAYCCVSTLSWLPIVLTGWTE